MRPFLAVVFGIICLWSGLALAEPTEREILRWVRDKPVIDSIVIDGNETFSDGRIKSRLYAKERTLWKAIKGDRRSRVQRETYGRDTLEVKYLYLTNGFLGVRVHETYEILMPDSSALVHVRIAEGRQFFIDTAVVYGEYPEGLDVHFDKKSEILKRGKPVNPVLLRQVQFELKTYLANRGYPYAKVAYTLDTSGLAEQTTVHYSVLADSLVTFGNITVEGMKGFPEYVARRELRIKPGELYRRDDILESQRRLFESGFFSTLQLNQSDSSPDRLRPDFTLRVRERKTRFISTELGAIGQSNLRDLAWQVSAGAGKRNLFGSRRGELGVNYIFSLGSDSRILVNKYEAKFTEPWLLGFRVPLTLTASLEPRLRVPDNVYKRRSWSLSAETLFRFGRDVRLNLGTEYESLNLSDFPEGTTVDGVDQTTSGRRKIYGEFRVDSRDNLFIPTRGAYIEILADYFGGFLGGDNSFYRLEASWSTYQIVWPGWVTATRFKGGMAEPFGTSDSLLTDDRLLTGGANSVRSFRENRLGPLDEDGNPVGGKYVLIANQEFRWKTVQIFNSMPVLGSFLKTFPLWQSVFVDVGGAFNDVEDIKPSSLAVAYGTGVQIVSPAGPIRLDYARRLETDNYDFNERWHFTILYAF